MITLLCAIYSILVARPVWNSQSLTASVDGQDVGHMAVIEPEPGGIHKDCPVIGVSTLKEFFWACSTALKFIWQKYYTTDLKAVW